MRDDASGLIAALEQSEKPGYLGSTVLVEALLRNFVRESLERWTVEPLETEHARAGDQSAKSRLAEILLGRVEGYAPQPCWNADGGLDAWVAEKLGLAETNPRERVEAALTILLASFHALVNECAEAELPMEDCTARINELIETWRNLLLGIEQPTTTTQPV